MNMILPVTAVMWLKVDHSLPGPTRIANFHDLVFHALLIERGHVGHGAKRRLQFNMLLCNGKEE